MYHADEVLSRCQIPYVVLGEIANQMVNHTILKGHRIVFGVMAQHAMPECTSLLKVVDPSIQMEMDGYRIITNGVPVLVKILTKKFTYLLNPDTVNYGYEFWRVPNPFNAYWKAADHLDK